MKTTLSFIFGCATGFGAFFGYNVATTAKMYADLENLNGRLAVMQQVCPDLVTKVFPPNKK